MMIAACLVLLGALPVGDEPQPLFHERVLEGVSTVCGSVEKDYIVEVNGGGLVLGDFDGDGAVDLVVVDGSTLERVAAGEPGLPPRLFLGDGAGGFAAAPAGEDGWGMAGGRWGMGGAAGDANGDGFLDLVVTEWGPDRVFLNREGKGIVETTAKAGLATDDRWSTSAALLDADVDGDLDLYVVGYLEFSPDAIPARGATNGGEWKGYPVMSGPEGLVPSADRFYRGRGDGTFEDATEESGIAAAEPGFGLGVLTVDVDADGDTDLYVTNDSTPNHLWRNDGTGKFTEVGFALGVGHDGDGKEQAGMGVTAGDLNGDGKPELFVTNFSGESNALYLSRKSGSFREFSARMGLGGPSIATLGWGTGMVDLDLDGDLDLYVLNGHVYPQADRPGTDTSYAQPDHLFRQDERGRFELERLDDGPDRVSRCGAAADLDGDGDLDLVAAELGGAVRVLENRATEQGGGHWLAVRLRGRAANRDGIGARVTVEWEGGSATDEVRTAGGYQTAVPAQARFGLGARASVARVVVAWPGGHRQVVEPDGEDGLAVDRVLLVEEREP